MSDPMPAVPTSPFRDELKDAVDRVTLFGRTMFDTGDQQPIKLRQPSKLLIDVITLSFDSLLHGLALPRIFPR
jgi:hypothetical protein